MPPSLQLRTAKGGEGWPRGSVQTIKWLSGDMPIDATLRIVLFRNSTKISTLVYKRRVSSGSYKWALPTWLTPGSAYRIRILCNDNPAHDASNANFSIT